MIVLYNALPQHTMNNGRAFIKHEILNIVTLLNFLILDTSLSSEKKREILGHLKLLGVLTAEEEFLADKKKQFLYQKLELKDILEMVHLVIEHQTKKNKIHLKVETGSLMIKGDRNVIKNGLENLLLSLMKRSKTIEIDIDGQQKCLFINYEAKETFKVEPGSALDYLKKPHEDQDILCKIAVEIMKASGIKIEYKKNRIKIKF